MSKGFAYRTGILCAEDVPLEMIAADIGTPFYCYTTAQLRANYQEFAAAFSHHRIRICYAVKANPNIAVIRILAECGAGADVTSAGEIERALIAGVRPEHIVFSGVGKKRDEIVAAVLGGLHQINIESIPELRLVSEVAVEFDRTVPICLRVNPDVETATHAKLATGKKGVKFGIDSAQLDQAMALATSLRGLDFKGFAMHIASHLADYEPFYEAYGKLADLVQHWRTKGIKIERLDLGGGVGIPYDKEKPPPLADYARIVDETVGGLGCELTFEPGRRLVGNAGVLVTRVLYDKQGADRRFLIIDAGMNDLIRPAMYDARHSIVPLRESHAKSPLADVVGPVCETSDLFGQNYELMGVGQNHLVAILQAGAYGAGMASSYNGRPLIPEILVAGAQFSVVRRRIAVTEQIAWESQPFWVCRTASKA